MSLKEGEFSKGKKVFTINGKMYIINDETGDIQTIHIEEAPIPPNELKEVIKYLAKIAIRQEREDD